MAGLKPRPFMERSSETSEEEKSLAFVLCIERGEQSGHKARTGCRRWLQYS
jgi:hypothetical protein